MALPVRSDKRTGRDNLPTIYSDFLFTFNRNPVTGYLGRVINEAAVSQMLHCLILTGNGEWPFEPMNGSQASKVLFELSDPISWDLVRRTIENAIHNLAPQVLLNDIQVLPNIDKDSLNILILYQIQNVTDVFSLSVVLRRIR